MSNLETQKLDAIVVLGASLREDENGQFELARYELFDGKPAVLGGDLRPLAAAQAYAEGLTRLLLITGGDQASKTNPDIMISKSRFMADQITALGVPAEDMRVIGKIGSTIGNVTDTINALTEDDTLVPDGGRLGVLSNLYHLGRAKAMFEQDERNFFSERNIKIVPIGAELLIARTSLGTIEALSDMYSEPAMVLRFTGEAKGFQAYLANEYQHQKYTT